MRSSIALSMAGLLLSPTLISCTPVPSSHDRDSTVTFDTGSTSHAHAEGTDDLLGLGFLTAAVNGVTGDHDGHSDTGLAGLKLGQLNAVPSGKTGSNSGLPPVNAAACAGVTTDGSKPACGMDLGNGGLVNSLAGPSGGLLGVTSVLARPSASGRPGFASIEDDLPLSNSINYDEAYPTDVFAPGIRPLPSLIKHHSKTRSSAATSATEGPGSASIQDGLPLTTSIVLDVPYSMKHHSKTRSATATLSMATQATSTLVSLPEFSADPAAALGSFAGLFDGLSDDGNDADNEGDGHDGQSHGGDGKPNPKDDGEPHHNGDGKPKDEDLPTLDVSGGSVDRAGGLVNVFSNNGGDKNHGDESASIDLLPASVFNNGGNKNHDGESASIDLLPASVFNNGGDKNHGVHGKPNPKGDGKPGPNGDGKLKDEQLPKLDVSGRPVNQAGGLVNVFSNNGGESGPNSLLPVSVSNNGGDSTGQMTKGGSNTGSGQGALINAFSNNGGDSALIHGVDSAPIHGGDSASIHDSDSASVHGDESAPNAIRLGSTDQMPKVGSGVGSGQGALVNAFSNNGANGGGHLSSRGVRGRYAGRMANSGINNEDTASAVVGVKVGLSGRSVWPADIKGVAARKVDAPSSF